MGSKRWLADSRLSGQAGVLAVVGLGIWLSLTVVLGPFWALIPVGAAVALLITVSPTVRIAFVVFGALLALQSSTDLAAPKLVYLLGMLVAVAGAAVNVYRHKSREATAMMRASALAFSLLGISLVLSLSQGTDPISYLRDGAAYLLLAATPILAADAGASVPSRTLLSMFVVAGILATVSYGLLWAGPTHRRLVDLPLDRLIYPSFLFAAALFAYATSKAMAGRKDSPLWLAMASSIFAVVLLSGARTTLVFLIIPVVYFVSRRFAASRGRRLLILAAAGTLIALTTIYLAQVSSINTNVLVGRFQQLITDPTSDISLQGRLDETGAAWNAFIAAPAFGLGLGRGFSFTGLGGVDVSLSADTTVAFLGKFGLVGLGFLILVIGSVRAATRNARKQNPAVALPIAAFSIFLICEIPLLNSLEEKGLGLALLLLIGMLMKDPTTGRVGALE